MGKEQPASYYDDVYSLKKDGGNKACNSYRASYKLSPYYEMWKLAISQTTKNNIIADLGCGVGQFASLCIANSRNYAIGIDFSKVAIEKAPVSLPKNNVYAFIFEKIMENYNGSTNNLKHALISNLPYGIKYDIVDSGMVDKNGNKLIHVLIDKQYRVPETGYIKIRR